MTLTEFLLARIAEDEAAAKAVPPLDHNFDMGGNRQDERFVFDRTLPSSADGMGNWSPHRNNPANRAHFARHDPARVLAECEAKRRIVEVGTAPGDDEDMGGCRASYDEGQACDVWEAFIRGMAAVYADHPDYREEWRG